MSAPEESVILCEGFHDRAFWKGWLEHLGCCDARPKRKSGYGTAVDPFGKSVGAGHFAFNSPSGRFLRVRPCSGDNEVLKQTEIRLKERKTQTLRHLLVNLDVDSDDTANAGLMNEAALIQAVEHRVANADSGLTRPTNVDFVIDGGATMISVVLWAADDPVAPHLPPKQTLERLVCAALAGAYPDRAKAVEAWLASRPAPPPPGPKEYAWSHMAGWYALQGCDDFYQAMWRDPAIVAELEKRLQKSGARQVVENFAR